MKPINKLISRKYRGAALIISLVFVLICSALAVSMASMSGVNLQVANNQHKANSALASAESGLEVMRYWLSRVHIPTATPPDDTLNTVGYYLYSDLADNNISNITTTHNNSKITVQPVTLDSVGNTSFEAVIQQLDANTLQMDITGRDGQIARTIRVNYNIEPYRHPIFDFGMATKGPLHFPGNPTVTGTTSNSEADIYIESENNNIALFVQGNTNFDGDISIGNANANVDFQGDISIAGEQGQAAIDNHVFTGVDVAEFPLPDITHFQQYATGNIIDSSTDTSNNMTLTNATIEAGANPFFGGNVTIEGILLIESPNKVIFNSNVELKGLIVADGDVYNPEPGTNSIDFLGNFATDPFPPDPQFDVIRHETGSSILAPGFVASFSGNFHALDGVMAVSGAYFTGNVNAVIKGTIINYSPNPTVVEGNATLNFDRLNNAEIPAGFDTERIMEYDPSSYDEIMLYQAGVEQS